jgi:hypothetical protein
VSSESLGVGEVAKEESRFADSFRPRIAGDLDVDPAASVGAASEQDAASLASVFRERRQFANSFPRPR